MDVKIIATNDCIHGLSLERELQRLGVPYEFVCAEDHPEVAERYQLRHSPALVIDDEVVFRGQLSESEIPSDYELKELLRRWTGGTSGG